MKITMIGRTEFQAVAAGIAVEASTGKPYLSEARLGQDLVEFAGRACYQSWNRPNPKTSTNEGYMAHILEVEHESVLHHATMSFYIEGVSRSLTHELVRHNHLDPSQLSQRFVVLKRQPTGIDAVPDVDYIVPPLFREDGIAAQMLETAWLTAAGFYEALLERGIELAGADGLTGTEGKKAAREAARAVLPNMTPTALVLTGNHRAWREAIVKRANPAADREIRELFVQLFRALEWHEPHLYQDMHLFNDGTADWVCKCSDHTPTDRFRHV